jgi:hypothetical protein
MQTLGLSDSTPRSEGRLRALLWPTIRNSVDYDYVTQQGFWVCVLVAAFTFGLASFLRSIPTALEGVFFLLAAIGVRERSRVAAVSAFSAYLMGVLIAQRYSGNGLSVVRIIFLALLLANVRGSWLAAQWSEASGGAELPPRLSESLADRFVDQLPRYVWPTARFVFYVLAALEIGFGLALLLGPGVAVYKRF